MFDVISNAKSKIEETKSSSVHDCTLYELPKTKTKGGHITPINNGREIIPFDIKRVFYLYDVPGGENRGAHAHKACHQLLIAASGSFEVILDDGTENRKVQINRPYFGLHILPGIWAQEVNFSSGAICLVLASHKYNEKDYLRNYDDFLIHVNNLKS